MNDGSISRDQYRASLSYKHLYYMQHLHSFRAYGWSVRNFLKVQSNPEDPVIRDRMLMFPSCTPVRTHKYPIFSSMC